MDANWTLKQVAFHPKLELIKNLVEELDPVLQAEIDQTGYRIAVLLLSAFAEGTNRHRLASFTCYPPDFIDEVARRMIAAGLWVDEEAKTDHWFDVCGNLQVAAFWADCLVAEGRVIRKRCPDGQFRYIAVQELVAGSKCSRDEM